jgi:flagellar hook-length control protein FliK
MKTAQPNRSALQGSNPESLATVNKPFSHHLLGSLKESIENTPLNETNSSSNFTVLSQLLGAEELAELELSEDQITALKQMKELDIQAIAEMLGVNLSDLNKLKTDLQKEIYSLSGNKALDEKEEIPVGDLGTTLHLVQMTFEKGRVRSKDLQGIEHLVKLVKVIELLANKKDLHITEVQKINEMKDLLKHIQHKVDALVPVLANQPKNWNEVMKAAFNRHVPAEDFTEASKLEQNKNHQPIPGNNLPFALPKTEQFTMTLSQEKGSVRYEQFVKELQTILSKSLIQSQPNMSKMLIKLYPEQLGSLRIELLQQNGIMTARILATSASAKELLDSQLQGLKQAFTSQNIQVEKIEISQALTDPERQSKEQSEEKSGGQAKQNQKDSSENNEEQDSSTFKEYLVNSEV